MQTLNINVSKIDKSALYEGKQGKYLNLTLMENRDGVDQYGNDGFIIQDIGKERRLAGEKGPIIGNWKHLEKRQASQNGAPPPPVVEHDTDDGDDIPF